MKVKGTIQSVSGPREFNNLLQIGFVLKENPKKWYNIPGEEKELKGLKEQSIIKGNEIIFEYDEKTGEVKEIKVVKKAESNDTDMTTFKDLLNDAHDKGLIKIETDMIQVDWESKSALFKATVHGRKLNDKGKIEDEITCSAHGDTTQENCGDMVKKHWIRMAETRAIVRALRFFTNNAAVASEETGGE